jgi:hypothetical protein
MYTTSVFYVAYFFVISIYLTKKERRLAGWVLNGEDATLGGRGDWFTVAIYNENNMPTKLNHVCVPNGDPDLLEHVVVHHQAERHHRGQEEATPRPRHVLRIVVN